LKKDTDKLVKAIVESMQEKKAHQIVSLDLSGIPNTVSNYYVICHADSNVQVNAIADFVERNTKEKLKERVWHKEGHNNAEWILLDYSNVIVHIFQREQRERFNIEGLWADAKIKTYKELS